MTDISMHMQEQPPFVRLFKMASLFCTRCRRESVTSTCWEYTYNESCLQAKFFIDSQCNMFGAYYCLLQFLEAFILFCIYLSLKSNNARIVKAICSAHGINRLNFWSK
nr:hypothetical protein Iba_chr01dCG6600 [Ipomoea batatas]